MTVDRATRSTLPPGTVVAERYVLSAVLGQGGSSTVYDCFDEVTETEVALKILDPEPEHRLVERGRLFREARLTNSIRHPGIVKVRGSGELDAGCAYLAMERLHGQTLAERLDECFWLPVADASLIAEQLLGALGAAHALGVVHRDVTPSNVFLVDGPVTHVKLIDFGIGRDLGDPSSRITAPDVVVGTIGYMAPEQLFGDEPTPQSDLYGVGATMYRMLAGRPPVADDGEVRSLIQSLAKPPPPLRELRPALEPELDDAVMTALAFRAQERYASCEEMAAACRFAASVEAA